MRRWFVWGVVLVGGCGSTPEENFLVRSSCSGFVSMASSQPGVGCSDGDGVMVPSGTHVMASCSLTMSGICFAAACSASYATKPDGGGPPGSTCDVVITAPTTISCACLEAAR